MDDALFPFWWFFLLLVAQRLGELALCARNRRRLQQLGGREHAPESYRVMFLLNTGFYLALLWEAYPFRIPVDLLTWSMLGGYLLVQLLRYWTILSLGTYWNTHIFIVPGTRLIRSGPYRWLRHPNYLVMTLEFALVPLLLRAPWTLLLFSIGNLMVLRQRIQLEERALSEQTDFKSEKNLQTD